LFILVHGFVPDFVQLLHTKISNYCVVECKVPNSLLQLLVFEVFLLDFYFLLGDSDFAFCDLLLKLSDLSLQFFDFRTVSFDSLLNLQKLGLCIHDGYISLTNFKFSLLQFLFQFFELFMKILLVFNLFDVL